MTAAPRLRPVGLSGLIVSFDDRFSDAANRAAIAFRGAVEAARWPGVEETSAALVSTFLRFDPVAVELEALTERVRALLGERDWRRAPLPGGRRLWRIPTVWGGEHGPQLEEAAAAAGMDPDEAVAQLSAARVRVLTIGFAPGQPYMGTLPPAWDIPRQAELTPRVPAGALVVAVRQLIVFSAANATGWRQVGRVAFRPFLLDRAEPFALRPGDEVEFPAVPAADYPRLEAEPGGLGGATVTPL